MNPTTPTTCCERERARIIELVEGMRKEEGQTKKCSDVLTMNYLIGRNKGWNEFLDALLSAIQKDGRASG